MPNVLKVLCTKDVTVRILATIQKFSAIQCVMCVYPVISSGETCDRSIVLLYMNTRRKQDILLHVKHKILPNSIPDKWTIFVLSDKQNGGMIVAGSRY